MHCDGVFNTYMTAPTDLPPPPPQSDPREPSSTPIRGRGASTPRRVHSPQPSRGTSPVRPAMQRTPSSDRSPLSSPPKAASPPLHAPTPRSHRASASSGFPAGLGAVLASGGPNSTSTPHHNSLHPHLSRPASPASINSSASAIFERDIEVPAVASLSLNPNASAPHTLSHKPSRLTHPTHGSTLDHTVPAVLDDAVEALTASEGQSRGFEGLEIEAPAPVSAVGMARQSSASLPIAGRKFSSAQGQSTSLSRSPSPASVGSGNSPIASPANSPPIMGQLSSSISSQSSREKSPTGLQGHPIIGAGATAKAIDSTASARSEASVPRPAMSTRMSTGPILPGGWAFGYGGNTAAEEEQVTESAPPSAEPPIPNANDEAEVSSMLSRLLHTAILAIATRGELTSEAVGFGLSRKSFRSGQSTTAPPRCPVASNTKQGQTPHLIRLLQ